MNNSFACETARGLKEKNDPDTGKRPCEGRAASRNSLPGGNSEREPPDPIPNSEVKTLCADGSVPCGHARVGHCQASNGNPRGRKTSGVFLCPWGLVALRCHPNDSRGTKRARKRGRFEAWPAYGICSIRKGPRSTPSDPVTRCSTLSRRWRSGTSARCW